MKKLFILVAMVLSGVVMMANPVDPDKAVQVAKNFVKTQVKMDSYNATLVYTHPMPRTGEPAFYAVNVNGSAFVLVAANDIAHPVLGYSTSRAFPEGIIPAHIMSFYNDLASQIEAAIEAEVYDVAIASEWQQLTTRAELSFFNFQSSISDSVGPLLTTTWDQGQYYNALCPEDANGPAGHALTGCVATAMAQIINYWGYPVHGHGIHSYNVSNLDPGSMCELVNLTGYGTLMVNYDSATYDYANMPDQLTANSTPAQINAVAQLMYHCGVSVNMFYDANASGAYEEDIRAAMISYFGFASSMGYADRQMYTDTEWDDSLRANINRGDPVCYVGSNIFNAHAFVLDGYKQNGFFHFNFGWSGSCDGWYLTKAVDAGFGYNEWQSAFMGVRPDSANNTVICHKKMNVQNRDVFTVTEPIDLRPLRGGSDYRATNEMTGTLVNLNIVPEDSTGQLVLDVLDFGKEQSVVIYDGVNKDSVLRVIETRGYYEWNRLTNYREVYWVYTYQPSDTVLRQVAGMDFSPVVSSRHGFTVVVYSYGGQKDEFHLRVSDASSCRMVSNLMAQENESGVLVSWTENGNATQWQVKMGETQYSSDSTHIFLTGLTPGASYNVQVRAVCGEGDYSSWNYLTVNKRDFWKDVVRSEPEGYSWTGDTIRIFSSQGLAWWSHCVDSLWVNGVDNYAYYNSVVSIENNIDLNGHMWSPIITWMGDINGNGYVIINMEISESEYYGGLVSSAFGIRISDLGILNARITAINSAAPLLGYIDNCQVTNCWSKSHIVTCGNGQGGGLIGVARSSKLSNCYAYGDIFAQFGYGGLVGYFENSEVYNCVTQVGEGFDWGYRINPPERRGLLTEEVHGGKFSNCFSDISTFIDPSLILPLDLSYLFLGEIYNTEMLENLVSFNLSTDTMGMLLSDTAVNYTLDENIDIIDALNNWVVESNSPDYRIWGRDSITHLPVLGGYYEVTCPNVSNITAENIPHNGGFAVALSWQENGDAENWQVKYKKVNTPDDSANVENVSSNTDTISGLQLGNEYLFYVRPLCGGDTVGWGQPIVFFVDKTLWIDVVTSQPDGFYDNGHGNVTISTPEGLAWLARIGFDYRQDTITIISDLDMGAYRWTPIGRYSFNGVIEGRNHCISNVYCYENVSDNNSQCIGLIGRATNASFNNIIIKNSSFTGNYLVGSLFGQAENTIVSNCQAINIVVRGMYTVGGLGGGFWNGEGSSLAYNCSSSGVVYAQQSVGGLFGSLGGSLKNCYSSCNVQPLGMANERYFQVQRGGLAGSASGNVYNCYSVGNVGADVDDNIYGSFIGQFWTGELHYAYSRQLDDLSFVGESYSSCVMSDTSSIVNDNLQTAITIANTTYDELLSALNAWVDANNTNGQYRHWAADSTGENGGFPVFAAIPCPVINVHDTVVACENYTWNGTLYNSSIVVTDTLFTVNGCDSIVTLHLTINTPVVTEVYDTACEGYAWYGNTFTATGDYVRTGPSAIPGSCDSTVTLHLTINNPVRTATTETACESYTWNNTAYTNSGNYTFSHLDINGCTQVDTLHLTINNPVHTATTETVCESYTWNNTAYTTSGNYTFSHLDVNGCTQVDTLHLTINNPVHIATTETACESYTWNNTAYTTSGNYTFSHIDANGCTQVDTLHLTINNPVHTATTETACETYTWNNTAYTTSGNYTFSHLDANGCTQVDTLDLTINNPVHTASTETVCESYTWNNTAYTTSGNYTFSHLDANGCTQVDTLHLTINNPVHTASTETACESYTWHNTAYTTSGNYTFSHLDANGCTQVDTLHLTINNPVHTTTTETACESYTWNNTTYTTSGNYTFSHLDVNGCTQVDTLHLTINNPVHTATTETACESYAWNNTTYTTSGNYTFSHLDANGCTQVDTLHLTINYSTTGDTTAVACDSFTWWNTNYTNSTNTPTHTYTNVAGCDSVVTLHLTINYSVETTVTETSDGSYTWNDETYTESGTYQWHGTTVDGCDSTVTLILTINTVGIDEIENSKWRIDIFPNPTTGWLTIDNEDVMRVEVMDGTGRSVLTVEHSNHIDLSKLPDGIYILQITTPQGRVQKRVILK